MKLRDMIPRLPEDTRLRGDMETEITSLCIDSRAVKPGALFFCTPGVRMDAHDFAPQAVASGAAALVVERELALDCPQVIVKSVRKATALLAAAFYGDPAKQMKLIGITGTKGKTTASYLVKSVCEAAGCKTGYIGTVGSMIGDEMIPTTLTTPDPLEVQSLLRKMADKGVKCVVMEVSAHAVAMDRLYGLTFEAAAFTNFSQDHLDYFGTMEKYLDAKMDLFRSGCVRHAVYNVDDEAVAKAFEASGISALRTGIREPADLYANDIEVGERGCEFVLTRHKQSKTHVSLKLAGLFNVYNALLAAGIAYELGFSPEQIREGLERLRNVPGRIELLETETPYRVILDYAHSPDSLENILKAVRATCRGRMIALFGCGGDRDRAKRPIMGEIAGKLADYCILTSDNPRNEDPMAILDAIEEGIRTTGCPYTVIENRREAIRRGLEMSAAGDVLILAGKGHETYQEIKGVKYPFDEKIVVAELLRKEE